MPPQLRAALLAGPDLAVDLDKLRETESQSLLANIIAIRRRLFASLDTAEEFSDGHLITRVASQLHTNLELTAKLLGDLGVGSTTINNVLIMPPYVEMRVELVRALHHFPKHGRPSQRCCITSSIRPPTTSPPRSATASSPDDYGPRSRPRA